MLRRIATLMLAILACAGSLSAQTDELVRLRVLDKNGAPVASAVIYREASNSSPPAPSLMAVVDQVGNQFVPLVTAIQAGTRVAFPNNDTVSHHVYSFSRPNNFELPLYKGAESPGKSFDVPGIVTLGCNIHDSMIGYIVVVDTPWFTVTDRLGEAALPRAALTGDTAGLRFWTPDLGESASRAVTSLRLSAGGVDLAEITIDTNAGSQGDSTGGSLHWDDY